MDCFKERKEELVLLYLRSYFQAMNIFNLITAYPRLVNDINLAETFDKLLDIHSLNNKSLIETFYLFKQLDDKNGFFLLGNIIDIKNTLKEDMFGYIMTYSPLELNTIQKLSLNIEDETESISKAYAYNNYNGSNYVGFG